MEIRKLSEFVGAEIVGIDARETISQDTRKKIYKTWADNSVLLLRNQDISPQEFVIFGKQFGVPIIQTLSDMNIPGCPELAYISGEDRDVHGSGKRIIRGTSWHTDHSYAEVPPKATILLGVDIPDKGGDTEFTSSTAAFEALGKEERTELENMFSTHAYQSSRSPRPMAIRAAKDEKRYPGDVTHPLVRTNPDTGRRSIYVNTVRTECILDMDREKSDALLDKIYAHLDQKKFQYRHKWKPGDIIIWDNRSVLHKANGDYEGKRFLYRMMIEGEKPIL